jgi:GABA(A) receptor-associated protein
MVVSFKSTHSFKDRVNEVIKISNKYPDRVPVICEKMHNAPKDCPDIDKNKYLIPCDLTVGQFIYVIRKRMSLPAEKALFLFINGIVPSSSSLLSTIYDQQKDEDGFLYVKYTFENTFG